MAPKRRLLLLSNSNNGDGWLKWCSTPINNFLGSVKNVLFIPFATLSDWDDCTNKLAQALPKYTISGIHQSPSMEDAVRKAESIMVSGGNTFHLLYALQENNLIDAIRDRVINDGIPYIGWSAGSNVACPNIKTTNDMPIAWPSTDKALNLFPYNINPHYLNLTLANFGGETRDDRLDECFQLNHNTIIGLPEGTGINVEGGQFRFVGLPITSPEMKNQSGPTVVIWKPDHGDEGYADKAKKIYIKHGDWMPLNSFDD